MNLAEILIKPFIKFCELTKREFHITGTGVDTDVYLIRYYVVQSKWFNIFIHRFMRSDRDDFHDHPWSFGTYVVKGGYREETPFGLLEHNDVWTNIRDTKHNRWATREAEQLHRVMLDRTYTLAEKEKAPITICVTGRTRRDWVFVKNGQWIFWKKYLGLPDDVKSRG